MRKFLVTLFVAVVCGCGPALYVGAGAGAGAALAKKKKKRRYYSVNVTESPDVFILPAIGSTIFIVVGEEDKEDEQENFIGVVVRYEDGVLVLLVDGEEILISFEEIVAFSSFPPKDDDDDDDKDKCGRGHRHDHHDDRHECDKDKDDD